MDRLKHLAVFIRVAENGSFSKCAEEFAVGQSTISKAIDALEEELGSKLLARSTRSVALTEEGRKVLSEAKHVVEAYETLLDTVDLKSQPKGTIKVTCPAALGSLYLVPRLKAFMKLYPDIVLRLVVTDSYLDFVDNDIDVAIRVGQLHEGPFVAKKVGEIPRIAVASAKYLQEQPAPKGLDDLQRHSCILVGKSAGVATWLSTGADGVARAIEVRSNIIVDTHLALQTAVRSGLGIGLGGRFLFEDGGQLKPGLVQILKKERFQPFPVHILFRGTRHLPARVRVFIDYIFEDLKKQEWLHTR